MSWEILTGDCVEAMRELDEASVDAIVTDPPYGLEFMGKEWDKLSEHKGGGWSPGNRRDFGSKVPNPTCRNCGGLFYLKAEGSAGHTKCRCNKPDFPNYRLRDSERSQEWHQAWTTEALRVLKPGGHLLAFGGTRTYHRLACAIEDAGFEIRDSLIWLYGSGFPKSLDVSKAIDKAAGTEGTFGAPKSAAHAGWIERGAMRGEDGHEGYQRPWMDDEEAVSRNARQYEPATPEAAQWEGWGTALKPAHEPIVVARKPLVGTVAQNVLEHGTGALNIDGCRITFQGEADERESKDKNRHADFGSGARENKVYGKDNRDRGEHGNYDPPGRWPANVVLSPEAAAELDAQSGERPGGNYPAVRGEPVATAFAGGQETEGGPRQMGDSGGASRFFYCAKASRGERQAGLDRVAEGNGKIPVCRCPRNQAEAEPLRATDEDAEAVGSGSSTTGSGSKRTDQSPKASKSTTSTATERTTASTTSPSSPLPSTSESTLLTSDELVKGGSESAQSAASGNPPMPSISTSARKAGSSTDDADPATSSALLPTSSAVVCPDCGGVRVGALRNAHPT